MDELNVGSRVHKVSMSNRKSCLISGVKDVVSFDIKEVILLTDLGILDIRGQDLHVSRLTLEKGEVDISGRIDCLSYTEDKEETHNETSILSRIFR